MSNNSFLIIYKSFIFSIDWLLRFLDIIYMILINPNKGILFDCWYIVNT